MEFRSWRFAEPFPVWPRGRTFISACHRIVTEIEMIKKTITISRQMGSGGSYIGQVIAKKLGLKYVDREVLHLAAKEFGCDEETVEARSERISSFWERVLGGLSFGG